MATADLTLIVLAIFGAYAIGMLTVIALFAGLKHLVERLEK